MKLHLGCGEKYIDDYINIDFPAHEHTVIDNVADINTDILTLKYNRASIDEIRLHHVFEHFTRPITGALLASWYSWLKLGGILHIEVPDFYRTSIVVLNPLKHRREKSVAIRHLFGSHEASWAVHCEGYTIKSLRFLLETYGFNVVKIKKNSYKGTYNFEIIAKRDDSNKTMEDFEKITRSYLKDFLLEEQQENKLLSTWMNIYNKQLQNTWAKDN